MYKVYLGIGGNIGNKQKNFDDVYQIIENELGISLSALQIDHAKLGSAEEKNCEQMFGAIPLPVGYAGPLKVMFSSQEFTDVHLPLATTANILGGWFFAAIKRGDAEG